MSKFVRRFVHRTVRVIRLGVDYTVYDIFHSVVCDAAWEGIGAAVVGETMLDAMSEELENE